MNESVRKEDWEIVFAALGGVFHLSDQDAEMINKHLTDAEINAVVKIEETPGMTQLKVIKRDIHE